MKQVLKKALRRIDDSIFNNIGPIRILFVIRNSLGMTCLLPLIKEANKRENIHIAITEEFEGCFDWPKD